MYWSQTERESWSPFFTSHHLAHPRTPARPRLSTRKRGRTRSPPRGISHRFHCLAWHREEAVSRTSRLCRPVSCAAPPRSEGGVGSRRDRIRYRISSEFRCDPFQLQNPAVLGRYTIFTRSPDHLILRRTRKIRLFTAWPARALTTEMRLASRTSPRHRISDGNSSSYVWSP